MYSPKEFLGIKISVAMDKFACGGDLIKNFKFLGSLQWGTNRSIAEIIDNGERIGQLLRL